MKRVLLLLTPVLFAALFFALTQQTLHARSNGYTGRTQTGCISCHQGGTTPEVALVGAQHIVPNSTTTYQLLITSTAPSMQTHAGFDLTVLDADGTQIGTLQTNDVDAQISDEFTNGSVAGELTHRQPKQNVDGVATVQFQWTAPITEGVYTVYFVGNSVNMNGGTSGDAWAAGSAEIQVGPALAITLRHSSTIVTASPLIVASFLLLTTSYLLVKRKRQP